MIAKAVKGKGFRGALEYDLNNEKGRITDTNMAGQNARELAKEFGEIRKLRPNLVKAVLHVSISAAPGENLSDADWREIGKRYMQGMGLDQNQFVITRHTDTKHEHIHILVIRIRYDGTVTSDSQDYRRQETIMREIEQDFGLEQVAPSHTAQRKAPTHGEIEAFNRTGKPSTKQLLQHLCDTAARGCTNYADYTARLEAAGVEVVPVVQLDGAKLSGLSYRLDGVLMKGSDLGKAYSPTGLTKRGIEYEQNRDYAGIRSSIERETARSFGSPDRYCDAGEDQERGTPGGDDRAAGASDGSTDGRNTAHTGADQPQKPGTLGYVQQPDIEQCGKMEKRSSDGGEGGGEHGPSTIECRGEGGAKTLHTGYNDRATFGDPRERILALAGTTHGAELPERASSGIVPETVFDRSLEAIQRQIIGLGVTHFEIGIRESKTGKMINKVWTNEDLLRSMGWLKRMNARGNDIYIRPSGEHGLVLLDGLNHEALQRLKTEGFVPAVICETSPGNYQAWVKLSDKPLSMEVLRRAARDLAKHYEGDPNSADGKHYGRLAGFTNQKPIHTKNGRQPYILAQECAGAVAPESIRYLEFIETNIEEEKNKQEKARRLQAIAAARDSREKTVQGRKNTPATEFQMQCQPWLKKFGDNADLSRVDFAASKALAQQGYSEKEIVDAILKASPNLLTRKEGHFENYAIRTARNAAADPDVVHAVHAEQQDRAASYGGEWRF